MSYDARSIQLFAPAFVAALLALTACGGGGSVAPVTSQSPIGDPTPTPIPTAAPPSSTASPGQINAPAAVSFSAVGTAAAQSVTISQANNVGGFTLSGCLVNGVTIATLPATTTGAFTITPVVAGVCTITVAGSGGKFATIGVTITTTVLNQQ